MLKKFNLDIQTEPKKTSFSQKRGFLKENF